MVWCRGPVQAKLLVHFLLVAQSFPNLVVWHRQFWHRRGCRLLAFPYNGWSLYWNSRSVHLPCLPIDERNSQSTHLKVDVWSDRSLSLDAVNRALIVPLFWQVFLVETDWSIKTCVKSFGINTPESAKRFDKAPISFQIVTVSSLVIGIPRMYISWKSFIM